MKCICMAEQLHTGIRSECTMSSIGGSGVKHAATGVMNHSSLSDSLMDESEFGECQENVTCLTALCQL